MSEAKRKEIDRNFAALMAQIDTLLPLHVGQYALMRNGEIIEFYTSWEDAYKTGVRFYEDGLFSVQKVTNRPVDLGYFSHAVHFG